MVSSQEEGHMGDLAASVEVTDVEHLRQQLALREQELGRVRAELVAAQARAASYEGEIARRDRRIRELVAMVADRDQRISAMRRTKTWRAGLALRVVFGAPLRLARAVARRVLPRETRRRLRQRYPWPRGKPPEAEPVRVGGQGAVIPLAPEVRTTTPALLGGTLADDALAYVPRARYALLYFPINPWGFRFQAMEQMVTQFARHGHKVFVMATTFGPGSTASLRQVAENVHEVRLPGPMDLNYYRSTMDSALVEACLAGLGGLRRSEAIAGAVCLVTLPFWRPLARAAQKQFGWKMVYYCVDR